MMQLHWTVEIFCCYAHEDRELLKELQAHLSPLQRSRRVTLWYDGDIIPGADWAKEIKLRLNRADLVLLLLSADFIHSEYCYAVEMQRAIERHQAGEAHVIPIILRPVAWEETPIETITLGSLQAIPSEARAVTDWPNRDTAWKEVAEEIGRVVNELLGKDHPLTKNETPPLMPSGRNHLHSPLSSTAQSRQELLHTVYVYWITGTLERSLNGILPLSLELKEQPDAVENPFEPVPAKPKQPGRLHPPGTPIREIYDSAGRKLLILGEPGSGKTTLLLQLAEKLLEHARQEETTPIPVVLKLSSWSEQKQSLINWILEEMHTNYHIPPNLSQSWINDGQIALLLDGLDEVTEKHRGACIDAINAYRKEQHSAPVVVSSRTAEYMSEGKLHRPTGILGAPSRPRRTQKSERVGKARSQARPSPTRRGSRQERRTRPGRVPGSGPGWDR